MYNAYIYICIKEKPPPLLEVKKLRAQRKSGSPSRRVTPVAHFSPLLATCFQPQLKGKSRRDFFFYFKLNLFISFLQIIYGIYLNYFN